MYGMLQLQRKMRRSRKGVLWYVFDLAHARSSSKVDIESQVSEVVELIGRLLERSRHPYSRIKSALFSVVHRLL